MELKTGKKNRTEVNNHTNANSVIVILGEKVITKLNASIPGSSIFARSYAPKLTFHGCSTASYAICTVKTRCLELLRL